MAIHKIPGEWQKVEFEATDGSIINLPPKPRIAAYFRCPEKRLAGKIDFLIDTGADYTTIMPADRDNIVIPPYTVEEAVPKFMGGVGGSVPIKYLPNVTLEFEDISGNKVDPITLDRIGILWPSSRDRAKYEGMPSLLGRDFINKCDLKMNFNNGDIILSLEHDRPKT